MEAQHAPEDEKPLAVIRTQPRFRGAARVNRASVTVAPSGRTTTHPQNPNQDQPEIRQAQGSAAGELLDDRLDCGEVVGDRLRSLGTLEEICEMGRK